jgi:hypothetical protein
LSNGRSLSVRQICTKSIHRPSRRAQAPTAPQRERASHNALRAQSCERTQSEIVLTRPIRSRIRSRQLRGPRL